ncbi:MAG: sugar ABC transporter permease [Thermaceae bacterium]|nr:sugar ABC transporter permease [Thermaceae bacterium]
MSRRERYNLMIGLLFISPWIIGFLAFLVYPIVSSAYLSFTRFSGFGVAQWIGWGNYTRMAQDALFWKSLYNTAYYTLLAVPIGVVVATVLAVAMNQRLREIPIYRAALYLPSVLPIYALSFIFIWLLNPRYGLLNLVLRWFGVPPIDWLGNPEWAKFSIVLLAQLGAGQYALIFLASIRGIPQTLYDSAEIDGATQWHKFRFITLPLITPVILYDVIIGLGLGLQVFAPSYIITSGGPVNSTLFYVYYLYNNAFRYSQVGYASALSWVLFILSVVLAYGIFRWSRRWVNYEVGS